MLAGLPSLRAAPGLRSRKSMLETLVRQLNMVRLSLGAIALLSLVGCTGLIDDNSDGLSQEERTAQRLWIEKAAPVLMTGCVACHNGSRPGVGFLAGAGELESADLDGRVRSPGHQPRRPAVVAHPHEGCSRWSGADRHRDLGRPRVDPAEKDAQPDPGETDPPQPRDGPVHPRCICTSGTPPAPTCPTNDVDLDRRRAPRRQDPLRRAGARLGAST